MGPGAKERAPTSHDDTPEPLDSKEVPRGGTRTLTSVSPPDFESNGAGVRQFPAEAYTASHSRISAVTPSESMISQRPYWSLSYPRCTSKVLPKVIPSLATLRVRRHEPLQLVEPVSLRGALALGRRRSRREPIGRQFIGRGFTCHFRLEGCQPWASWHESDGLDPSY